MGLMIASLLWGFSEATLFFIIPDVLLSAIALKSGKKAFKACFYALASISGRFTSLCLGNLSACKKRSNYRKSPCDQSCNDARSKNKPRC